jgi:sulfur relay protein TusB/DsrH
MSTLFILHRSDPARWNLVSKLAKSGDAIVLIQDGVAVTARAEEDSGIENLVRRGVRIVALKTDMDARKLSMKLSVEGIDYEQLVDLMIRYDRTFS